jgi:hypothetical protein
MNVGGGEAADQMVRMMLSGSEVAVRLSGSALKNALALTLALAKNHKQTSGKVNLGKMLRETRDLRQFPMTPEQYAQFQQQAKKQKLLYSAIHDRDAHGKRVDVVMPVTEVDRANPIFERILYREPDKQPDGKVSDQVEAPKKDSRSGRDSRGTKPSSSISKTSVTTRTTHERPSVEGRLKQYRTQLAKKPAPTKQKTHQKGRAK